MSDPEDPFLDERAIHEAGHLVVLSHLYGGLANAELRVVFVTLNSHGPSGGSIEWNPGSDRDPEKLCAVHIAGLYANGALGRAEDIERYKGGARDDLRLVEALGLSDEQAQRVVDHAIDVITRFSAVIQGVADELKKWKTFFGFEALGVVHAHMHPADAAPIRARLHEYRETRLPATPPEMWMNRGKWSEPFEDWLMRRYPPA